MTWKTPATIGALTGATLMLSLSTLLLQNHFQTLKDVREYALPLAADIAPLERRMDLLNRQMELSELEAGNRSASATEQLHVYVLPQSSDLTRLLAFLESTRTFLERRGLLRSMTAIEVGDPVDDLVRAGLQSRALRFSATMKPEGREQLFSILGLSGILTVGDVLSPGNITTLFRLTEEHNYAAIVAVERFLSADLLGYAQQPTLTDERLAQALSSEEFLSAFTHLLSTSDLPSARAILTGDLGRTLAAQKLWPVQFMTIEKESLKMRPDGLVEMDLTVKAYARK